MCAEFHSSLNLWFHNCLAINNIFCSTIFQSLRKYYTHLQIPAFPVSYGIIIFAVWHPFNIIYTEELTLKH